MKDTLRLLLFHLRMLPYAVLTHLGAVEGHARASNAGLSRNWYYLVPRRQPIISCLHYITHLLLLSSGTPFANLLVPHANLYVILIQTRTPYKFYQLPINNQPTSL
jgi:hypothetical protein